MQSTLIPWKKSYCHQCNEKAYRSGCIITSGYKSSRAQISVLKPHFTHYLNNDDLISTEQESDTTSPDHSSDSSYEHCVKSVQIKSFF